MRRAWAWSLAGRANGVIARFAVTSRNVSFVDLYAAHDAQSRGIGKIYCRDMDFDNSEGITRVEPSDDLSR